MPALALAAVLLAAAPERARAADGEAVGAVPAPALREQEVRDAVARVLADCARGDADAVAGHFDLVRLAREIARADVLGDVDIARRSSFEATVAISVRNAVLADPTVVSSGDAQIRRVVLDESGDEAQVFLRQRDPAGYRQWSRWWLARRNSAWRLHDIGDVDSGIRLSLATAALVAAESEVGTEAGTAARTALDLRAAARSLAVGDVLAARERLDAVGDEDLSPLLAELRAIVAASIALSSGLPARALAALDGLPATSAEPPPVTLFLRALAHGARDENEAAHTAAVAYVALVGGDAGGWIAAGDALVRLERPGEARAAYAGALEDDPASVNALAGLLALLDPAVPADAAELRRRLGEAGDLGPLLEALGLGLIERGACARVDDLAAAAAGEGPDARVRGLLLVARARAESGRLAEGAEILAALAGDLLADDADRYVAVSYAALDLQREAGGAVSALDTSLDPFLAFPYLAELLIADARADELEQVIAVYSEREPGDPSVGRYRAHLHALRGEHREAARGFRAALASAEGWQMRSDLHALVVRSAYRAGTAQELIDELSPRAMTVERLANEAFTAGDAEFLAALVERQVRDEPHDPALPLWRAAAASAAGRPAAVVAALASFDEAAASPGLIDLADDLRVRALLRLGRHDAALDAAHASSDRDGDPFHVAVVHAVSGDVEHTGAALATLEAIGYRAEDLAADRDIGPALRSEAFAELAKRFGPR